MYSPVSHIIRRAIREGEAPLNILTCPTHERAESTLCLTGHNFYAYRSKQVKDWNYNYAPLPPNYKLLDMTLEDCQVPSGIEFDLVLSQNKFGQFQILKGIADQLHLPLISLEHTLPMETWNDADLTYLKSLRGDINIFITEYSRAKWGWGPEEAEVIHHGIDAEVFVDKNVPRNHACLSVVNDWINRDVPCGYTLWTHIKQEGLPVVVLGDTPGLSSPAKSIAALVDAYNENLVFLNTSLVSPVPTVLLEAMACGACVVSTATCQIPYIIDHGVNGLLFDADKPEDGRRLCQQMLQNPDVARTIGKNARNTVLEKYSMVNFIQKWDEVLKRAANCVYTGR